MEALGTLWFIIGFGTIGLVVSFAFACAAMMRGETPVALTLLGFALPPLTVVVVFLRPHFA